MFFDEIIGDGKSKPGMTMLASCGVKGLKDPVYDLITHTDAFVLGYQPCTILMKYFDNLNCPVI